MSLTIALVGKPNVGKSTLFNLLTKSRQALVSNFKGLTRDRQYASINKIYCDNLFKIIDTGGINNEKNNINTQIEKHTFIAIDESDIIYFMVDAKDGLNSIDINIAHKLQKLTKKIILVCNKAEKIKTELVTDFYELGFGSPVLISAEHNKGIENLIKKTISLSNTISNNKTNILPQYESLTQDDIDKEKSQNIAISIIGRPNVGKSTLVNHILGKERVLANNLPGTTRDSIYIDFIKGKQKYTLIDTAGIRRKRSTKDKIEKFSIIKAIEAVDKSHVSILVLDAQEAITEQDSKLLGMIHDKHRALIIAVNKWDNLNNYQKSEIKRKIEVKFPFIKYASINYISALHGYGIEKLFIQIKKSFKSASKRHTTSTLNKIMVKINQTHQSQKVEGRTPKIKYVHQSAVLPPTFIFYGNHLKNVPNSYERYLKNTFINELKLANTTIKIQYKNTDNPFKDKKNKLNAKQISKRKRLVKFTKKNRN